jgi:hypothetical protein
VKLLLSHRAAGLLGSFEQVPDVVAAEDGFDLNRCHARLFLSSTGGATSNSGRAMPIEQRGRA